jgi:hypothetical protein
MVREKLPRTWTASTPQIKIRLVMIDRPRFNRTAVLLWDVSTNAKSGKTALRDLTEK